MGIFLHPQLGIVRATAERLPDHPDGQVERTIELMEKYAQEDSRSIRSLASRLGLGSKNKRDYCSSVWRYVSGLVRFVYDEELLIGSNDYLPVEVLIRPVDLVASTKAVGDCDDFSMLAASLLLAGGVRCCYCTVSADGSGHWSHVYVVGYPDGIRFPMDTSHGEYPGWETTNKERLKEWKMLMPSFVSSVSPGLGFDWDFTRDLINTGVNTAGTILTRRYSVPEMPSAGVYRAPDGTIITTGSGTVPSLVQGTSSIANNMLLIGMVMLGVMLVAKK